MPEMHETGRRILPVSRAVSMIGAAVQEAAAPIALMIDQAEQWVSDAVMLCQVPQVTVC
jgi:hypothetical protein